MDEKTIFYPIIGIILHQSLRIPLYLIDVVPGGNLTVERIVFAARIHSSSNPCIFRSGEQVAELLVSAGADVRAKNGRGEMPMDLARNEMVLALLLSAAQELDKREEEEEEVGKWSSGARFSSCP